MLEFPSFSSTLVRMPGSDEMKFGLGIMFPGKLVLRSPCMGDTEGDLPTSPIDVPVLEFYTENLSR